MTLRGRRSFLVAAAGSLATGLMPSSAAEKGDLRAGAARVDITPPLGVTLDGTIMRIGPAEKIHDPLHARCLVLDDGGTTLAITTCDATMISRDVVDRVKRLVNQRTGLAMDRILIAGTHTHMAPRMVGIGKTEIDLEYYETFVQRTAESVGLAIDRLAPAKIAWASQDVPEFCENRRWIMKEGSVGPNPFGATGERVVMGGRPAENRLRPAGPIDPQLSVLSVQSRDGRPIAVLGNYSIHYTCYAARVISADYFGGFCRHVEEMLANGRGAAETPVGIMTNGTSGNIGRPGGGIENIDRVGKHLATIAADLIQRTEHRSDLSLAMCQSELELTLRRPDEERIAWAKAVLAGRWDQPAHGWKNIYAQNALQLAEYPATWQLVMQAIRIGSMGIAAIPCEVFAETGLAIKRSSPLQPTFSIELANGYFGYLPPPEQFELGGYETWPAVSSCLEIEAEPKIRNEALKLLARVQGNA